MLNIPPRPQHSAPNTPQIKRRNKTTPSKEETEQSQTVKRHMERRHKQDRRQKRLRTNPERRKLNNRRNKHGNLIASQSISSADQINTVGLHINTSA